jgi:hypothetical protein
LLQNKETYKTTKLRPATHRRIKLLADEDGRTIEKTIDFLASRELRSRGLIDEETRAKMEVPAQ